MGEDVFIGERISFLYALEHVEYKEIADMLIKAKKDLEVLPEQATKHMEEQLRGDALRYLNSNLIICLLLRIRNNIMHNVKNKS